MEDEQVIRTDTGWAFYPKQDGNLDIGFYTEKSATGTKLPVWSLSVTPEKKLVIKNGQTEVVMEAAQDKSFLLHGNLMVEETVTASAYKTKGGGGVTPGEDYLTVPADKKWHDLPLDVSREGFGCRVYRIYASFREPGTGFAG